MGSIPLVDTILLKRIDALEQQVQEMEEQLHRLTDIVNVIHLREQQQARKQKDGEQ